MGEMLLPPDPPPLPWEGFRGSLQKPGRRPSRRFWVYKSQRHPRERRSQCLLSSWNLGVCRPHGATPSPPHGARAAQSWGSARSWRQRWQNKEGDRAEDTEVLPFQLRDLSSEENILQTRSPSWDRMRGWGAGTGGGRDPSVSLAGAGVRYRPLPTGLWWTLGERSGNPCVLQSPETLGLLCEVTGGSSWRTDRRPRFLLESRAPSLRAAEWGCFGPALSLCTNYILWDPGTVKEKSDHGSLPEIMPCD